MIPGPEGATLAGADVVAFAGIARPGKFFDTLRANGCRVLAAHGFADHHVFDPDEIMMMAEHANAARARLVTTAKDAVRLPEDARNMIQVFHVGLEWDALDDISALVRRAVAG